MTTIKQSLKTLDELPKRLILFAELLASGTSISASAAARQVGFKNSTASAGAYRWIGKTREGSRYPHLYDYFEKLRVERLRLYEINEDSVAKELRLIAFSSIENYLDFPSLKVKNAIEKIQLQREGLHAELKNFEPKEWADLSEHDYNRAKARYIFPKEYHDTIKKILAADKQIKKLQDGPGYTLRLKYKEDIPKELMPAIAEIRETREGIAVKLHSKLDGLDKLAKYLKMYSDERDRNNPATPVEVKEINIIVHGSKSDLLTVEPGGASASVA